jgi:4-hydroxy 2-oxovalerate aldolase
MVELLDCTLRDGGYVNNWHFSKELARESYRALSKAGVSYIEVGFRGTDKYFDPERYGFWRFTPDELIREITENIKGSKISVMGDFGKIDLDDLSPADESLVDLVRIAVHKNKVMNAVDLLDQINAKGYLISLQCMGYSTYSDAERHALIDRLKSSEVDYVYVADSYGSMLPFQIPGLFEPLLEAGFRVGFHPHNNIQMAFANTVEAIRTGVHIIDSSIYGMGRGAGNLPTEIILSYLMRRSADSYNVLPVLNCIERFFLDLRQETPWGYELPYMISGMLNCHPNYSKEFLRRKTFSMEDIWAGIECIRELQPVGFSADMVEKLISSGLVSASKTGATVRTDETVAPISEPLAKPPYIDRHKGREFLVLANGPNLKKQKGEIDEFIRHYNPVVLGANYLGGLFIPDYHAFNNNKRFVSYINEVDQSSRLLLGINLPPEMIREYVDRDYESLVFHNLLEADFDLEDGVITANCGTISVLLVGIALVMGADRVFVAGMDGYLDRKVVSHSLFYDEKFDYEEHDLNVKRHQTNERFLKQIDEYILKKGGEGVHIITPTTHTRFYKNPEIV